LQNAKKGGWFEMKLCDLRKKKHLTMREVGLMANISESMYSLIENGKRRPSVDVAKRIAAVLDFDWTKFFEK
jgi:transcriptional regulator with XRE-family HTH domain